MGLRGQATQSVLRGLQGVALRTERRIAQTRTARRETFTTAVAPTLTTTVA
jgi:hypothetical protein